MYRLHGDKLTVVGKAMSSVTRQGPMHQGDELEGDTLPDERHCQGQTTKMTNGYKSENEAL